MRLFGPEPVSSKEKRRPAALIGGFVAAVMGALILCVCIIAVHAMPRIEKIVLSSARTKASSEIDEAILNYFEANAVTYGKLVKVSRDNNGAISSVTADAAAIDSLIARFDDEIGSELEEKVMETEIPVNAVLGTELFVGGGPKIKIHFFPINIVNIQARHEFVSKGINQTLHTIYIDLSVDIEVMFPLKHKQTKVESQIMIGQTLIVGGVPNTYVKR